jgi:type VI secretion system protein VasG
MSGNGLSDALRTALDKFTLDVTARAREGKIDPVFGRDNEIRQMVDISQDAARTTRYWSVNRVLVKPLWWKGWRCASPKATSRTP